ncbi:hypothetical protein KCV06_g212, partial [Aureobasidium melanogenum]
MFRSFSYVTFRTQVSISFLTGGACNASAVGDSGVCSGDSNHLSGFLLRVEKGANRVFALRTFGGHNAVKQEILVYMTLQQNYSLLPVTSTLDESAEVPNWKLEGEVKSSEHDGEEDPPAAHVGDKSECSGSGKTSGGGCGVGSLSSRVCGGTISKSKVPVSTGQTAKCEDQGEEDHGEDDVVDEMCDGKGWRGWLRRHQSSKDHQRRSKKRLQRTYSGIFSNSSGEIEMLPAYFQLECAISARYLLTIEVLLDWRTRLHNHNRFREDQSREEPYPAEQGPDRWPCEMADTYSTNKMCAGRLISSYLFPWLQNYCKDHRYLGWYNPKRLSAIGKAPSLAREFCFIVERFPKVTSRICGCLSKHRRGCEVVKQQLKSASPSTQSQSHRTTWIDCLFSLIDYGGLVSRLAGAGAANSSFITVAQSEAYEWEQELGSFVTDPRTTSIQEAERWNLAAPAVLTPR